MKCVQRWDSKKLIAEISGRVVSGMENACQFAEGQAQSRVLVRTGLTRSDITHEVSAEGDVVEGRIGIPKGKAHAWYWIYHERGTSRQAAHPALRPAVFDNAAEIVRLIAEG